MLHNTAASSEGFHCKKNWVGPKCVLIIWREQIPYSTVIFWRLNTMSKPSQMCVFLWVNAWEHHLPAIWQNYLLVVLHYFPFVISSWSFYDNFCTIRTEQKHYYRTVREYGFDSTSCSNHMQLFYTLTTTQARQRLSGSTLLFGFGFLKAPFLLASCGFLFLESLLKYVAEVGFWLGASDIWLTEECSVYVIVMIVKHYIL